MALTNGLTRKKLAGDLGAGRSAHNKWASTYGGADTLPEKEAQLVKEIDRLRRDLRIVTEEGKALKKLVSADVV